MNLLDLSEQEIIRRGSLEELRKMGIDPYPAAEYKVNAYTNEIKSSFKDEDEPRQVSVAGRIMSRRIMGKASFIELKDSTGRIQVYISRDDLCPGEDKELYNTVFKKLLDIGDFIGIKGFVFRTQMGEITIHAQELTVLSKSLRPLPIVKMKDGVAYDAFEDPELRYRQRYVDLVVNEGVKDIFIKRNKIYNSMREYFVDEFPFAHCFVCFDSDFFADFAQLVFIHSGNIDAGKFFDGIDHCYPFERRFKTDDVVADFYFGCSVHV